MFSLAHHEHSLDKGLMNIFRFLAVTTICGMSLLAWSCSSTTEPTPDPTPRILDVDTSNGHTEIDTAELRDELMNLYASRRPESWETPPIARLHEVEEAGSEAIHHILEKYADGIAVLSDIHNAEMSQMAAMEVIIDVLDIDDTNPDTVIGDFVDDELQAVWDDHVDHSKHSSKLEAVVAVARVFEFQLNEAMEVRDLVTTPTARFCAAVFYAMNKNHFIALLKHLRAEGYTYTPKYLSQDEFNDASQAIYALVI